jgi:cytochrome c biogenesis protein CcdA
MSPRFFSKAVLFGWNALKKNARFILGLLAIVVALNISFSLIMSYFSEEAPFVLVVAVGIIIMILETLIGMGIIKICLKFCEQEPASYEELFSAYPLLINYIAGSIMFGAMVDVWSNGGHWAHLLHSARNLSSPQISVL